MREQDRVLLSKSIGQGILVGLAGPAVLVLVLSMRFGMPDRAPGFLLGFVLFCVFPSVMIACVGGCAACRFEANAFVPHGLVTGIVFAFFLGVVYYFRIDDPGSLIFFVLQAANTWLCGWWSIRVVRRDRSLAERRLAGFPPGYQDHFAVDRRPDDVGSPHVRGSLQGFSDEPSNDTTEDESA